MIYSSFGSINYAYSLFFRMCGFTYFHSARASNLYSSNFFRRWALKIGLLLFSDYTHFNSLGCRYTPFFRSTNCVNLSQFRLYVLFIYPHLHKSHLIKGDPYYVATHHYKCMIFMFLPPFITDFRSSKIKHTSTHNHLILGIFHYNYFNYIWLWHLHKLLFLS